MKRRNVFLCAVFFSVGIVFAVAEEPADETMRRETIYLFGNPVATGGTNISFPSFSDSIAGNDAEDAVLSERHDSTMTESARNDYSAYRNDATPKNREASISAAPRESLSPEESEFSKDETAAQATSRTSDGNEMLHVYDFSVPFDDKVTETIGFTNRDGRENPLVFHEVIPETTDISLLSDDGSYLFLSFIKNTFTNDQNGGKVLTGDSYLDEGAKESIFDIISSLFTIPFALLSIAVCAGTLLIMFTSTGKKANT